MHLMLTVGKSKVNVGKRDNLVNFVAGMIDINISNKTKIRIRQKILHVIYTIKSYFI